MTVENSKKFLKAYEEGMNDTSKLDHQRKRLKENYEALVKHLNLSKRPEYKALVEGDTTKEVKPRGKKSA